MNLRRLFIYFFFIPGIVYSQSVNLNGRVLNENNQPVSSVIDSLKNLNISDTTGADGVYHLSNGTNILNKIIQPGKNKLAGFIIQDNKIQFMIYSEGQELEVELFDLQGRKEFSLFGTYNKGIFKPT
jgi:hypothetical protein